MKLCVGNSLMFSCTMLCIPTSNWIQLIDRSGYYDMFLKKDDFPAIISNYNNVINAV